MKKEILPLADQRLHEKKKIENLEKTLTRYQPYLLERLGNRFMDQLDPQKSIRVDGISLEELDFELLLHITGLLRELEGEPVFGERDDERLRRMQLENATTEIVRSTASNLRQPLEAVLRGNELIFAKGRSPSFDIVPNAQHVMLLCPNDPPKHWTNYALYVQFGHVTMRYRGIIEQPGYVPFHLLPTAQCGLPMGPAEQELLKKYLQEHPVQDRERQ